MNKRRVYGIFGSMWVLALGLAVAASAAPPSGFQEATIGDPEPGSVEVADGVWTVNGAGNNWRDQTEDQLYFVYRSINGNGSIQARLLEQAQPGQQYAGVMIRGSIDANSPFAGPTMTTDELAWIYRTAVDEPAIRVNEVSNEEYPKWMRAQRVGNAISAFTSADGRLWEQVAGPVELPLTETALFGISLSSRDPFTVATTQYDNVQVLEGVVSVSRAEGAASDTMALLAWDPVATAVGYNIYRGATVEELKLVNTAGPHPDPFFSETGTSLRNMRYAVGGVFKNADGSSLEGPLVLVR